MRTAGILLLQLPLESLEGSGHFILFLNHQIVLHPERWSWHLKGAWQGLGGGLPSPLPCSTSMEGGSLSPEGPLHGLDFTLTLGQALCEEGF